MILCLDVDLELNIFNHVKYNYYVLNFTITFFRCFRGLDQKQKLGKGLCDDGERAM